MKDDVTLLELTVLVDIVMERDPWRDCPGVGSRTVSQALGRLRRKGLVEWSPSGTPHRLVPTAAGRKIVPLKPTRTA